MARIVGVPGCTTELLAELRGRGVRDLNSFSDVERFHASRDTIIEDIERRAAERRAELTAELSGLPVDLARPRGFFARRKDLRPGARATAMTAAVELTAAERSTVTRLFCHRTPATRLGACEHVCVCCADVASPSGWV